MRSGTRRRESEETCEVQTDEVNEMVNETDEQSEQVEEVAMEGEEAFKMAAKRRRKTSNTSSEAKTSRVSEEMVRKVCTDDSESDECVLDESEVPNFSSSQQRKLYTAEKIKSFLKQTYNQQGVKIEDFFPDLALFCSSVRFHKRLKKLVLKVKKQINIDDGICSNVHFN